LVSTLRAEVDNEAGKRSAPLRRRRRCRAFHATQNGANSREQLARIEGLAEIVVGAQLKPDDAVDVVMVTFPP
jgi:hypothetical protein